MHGQRLYMPIFHFEHKNEASSGQVVHGFEKGLILEMLNSDRIVPLRYHHLKELEILGSDDSLCHVGHHVYEAVLDDSVYALPSRRFRRIPLKYLHPKINQIKLMLISISIQKVADLFCNKVYLFEVLVA